MATEEERTFNEAMNEWAAKQSFFQDPRNRLVHPDPSLPLPFRIFGYLFRIAVVVFLIWLLSVFVVGRYIKGSGFSNMLNEKLAAHLKAEDFEARNFAWKDSRATSRFFEATGSREAFYKKLTTYGLSFEIPKNKLFNEEWELEGLRIADLDMLLRVGRTSELTGVGDASALATVMAGFGIDPDLSRASFDQMEIDQGTFRWGVSAITRGKIEEAPLVATPPGDGNDGWSLLFKGGTLTQNWWRGVGIDSLKVSLQPDRLVFTDGVLAFSNPGDAALSGELRLGAVPRADMQIAVTDADAESFVPAAFHRYIGGKLNASISISGSPNTQTGLSSQTTLEFAQANIREIPIFQALSMLLDSSRLRMMPLTGGTVTLSTGGGVLDVTDVDITSERVGRIRGAFKVTPAKEAKTEEGKDGESDLLSIERSALASMEATKLGVNDWEFEGELRFGARAEFFPALAKKAAAGLFQPDSDGYSWMTIPLSGTLAEITREQHDTIVQAIKRSE